MLLGAAHANIWIASTAAADLSHSPSYAMTSSPSTKAPSLIQLYSTTDIHYPAPPPLSSHLRLVQLHIVHRHGARTPKQTLTNDYTPTKLAPKTWQQCIDWQGNSISCDRETLSVQGAEQARKYGQWLRATYGQDATHTSHQLIPPTYNPVLHYTRSTPKDRTKTTLMFVLRGLYKDVDVNEVNKHLQSKSADMENMYGHPSRTPQLNAIYWESYDALIKQLPPRLDEVREAIARKYKLPIGNLISLTDTLISLLAAGVVTVDTLPSEVSADDLNAALLYGSKLFYHITRGDTDINEKPQLNTHHLPVHSQRQVDALKLAIGGFIYDLLQPIQRQRSTTAASIASSNSNSASQQPSIYQYCGHDTTLLPLCEMLGLGGMFESQWPTFLANVVVEVSADDSKSAVDALSVRCVVNHNSNIQQVTPLIPLQQWLQHMQTYALPSTEPAVVKDGSKSETECHAEPFAF